MAEIQKKYPGDFDKVRKAAAKADAVVVFVGEEAILSGEAHSLSNLNLQGAQSELIAEVAKTGKPVVVVVIAGRPLTIERDLANCDAMLYSYHPGTMGGMAVADLVSGDFSPSGHLAMSFPRCDGQIPIRYNYKNTGRPTKWKVPPAPTHKFGNKPYSSCYMFTPNTPLYPFGYGLSYTNFEFSDMKMQYDVASTTYTFEVKVTNTGDRPGKEVVQLYLSSPAGKLQKEYQSLEFALAVDKTKLLNLFSGNKQLHQRSSPFFHQQKYQMTGFAPDGPENNISCPA